jgi:hypothetical protein
MDMTRSLAKRSAAGIAAGFVLGVAAPVAAARPIDVVAGGSAAPAGWTAPSAAGVDPTGGQLDGDGIPDWAFVVVGSGVTSLAVVGVGGARVARRRRRQRTAAPIT